MNHYVIICGGRDPEPGTLQEVEDVLTFLHMFYEGTLRVMHGDAPGVDTRAQDICERREIPVKAFPADWGRGRSAGPERNKKMAQLLLSWTMLGHSGEVIAFQGGRGTKHMATFAEQCGLSVTHIPEPEPAHTQIVDLEGRVVSDCADGNVRQGRRSDRRDDREPPRGLFDNV